MPGFDGTGPRGMGPMTGGGRGYCAAPVGRRGYGMGMGYRRPLGGAFGARRGWGLGGRGFAWEAPRPVTPQDELSSLRQEALSLEAELKEIQARIDELS